MSLSCGPTVVSGKWHAKKLLLADVNIRFGVAEGERAPFWMTLGPSGSI